MAKLRGAEMTGYLYAISTGTLLLAGTCITIAKSVDYKVMIRTIMDFEGKKNFLKREVLYDCMVHFLQKHYCH